MEGKGGGGGGVGRWGKGPQTKLHRSTDLGDVHSLIFFHCHIVDHQINGCIVHICITIRGEAQVPSYTVI